MHAGHGSRADQRCQRDRGGNGSRREGRGAPRRHGADHQRRHQHHRAGGYRRRGPLPHREPAARRLPAGGRAHRLQDGHRQGRQARGEADRALRPHPHDRPDLGQGRGRRRGGATQGRQRRDRLRRVRTHDQGAPAQRPQLPPARLPHPGRDHRERGLRRLLRQHRGHLQRPQLAAERVPARRRHEYLARPHHGRGAAPGRRHPRVQGRDHLLLRRVRPRRRRGHQRRHQERHQRVSRRPLGVLPQRQARRQRLLLRHQAPVPAEPVRRHDRRPHPQGQALLLRQLGGEPHPPGRQPDRHGPDRPGARRGLLAEHALRREPDLRPVQSRCHGPAYALPRRQDPDQPL